MISLVSLVSEANLPAVPNQGQNQVAQIDRVDSDIENIRQKFAECLDIDPSEVQVKKSEKASIADYGDMSKTGDILISCPKVKELGADRVTRDLNGFGFLEDISINGQSGHDLSALVFADSRKVGGNPIAMMMGQGGLGDLAGGDVIITSKDTEFRLVPFMARMGINTANCEDAMENYWNMIGGKAISDNDIMRAQQQLAAGLRPRLGARQMRQLPNRQRQRVPVAVPRFRDQEIDDQF